MFNQTTHDSEPATEPALARCLQEAREGRPGAEIRLIEIVYAQVRHLAGQRMKREGPGHLLQPTALANEACIKILGMAKGYPWENTSHFFATCARTMRFILIDHARKYQYDRCRVDLLPGIAMTEERSAELIALDTALEQLARFDPRGAKAIELTAFLGLTYKEAADALGVAERTVKRDVLACKAWLRQNMAA